jgi:hypothetical protein
MRYYLNILPDGLTVALILRQPMLNLAKPSRPEKKRASHSKTSPLHFNFAKHQITSD